MGLDFFAVLDQVLARLHSRGRVTYNALKLQFNLDDASLAVLKEELLYTHPEVVDDAGRGLIWTGALASAPASAPLDALPVLPPAPVRPAPEAVNNTSVAVRYPDDLSEMISQYPEAIAQDYLERTKELLTWVRQDPRLQTL